MQMATGFGIKTTDDTELMVQQLNTQTATKSGGSEATGTTSTNGSNTPITQKQKKH